MMPTAIDDTTSEDPTIMHKTVERANKIVNPLADIPEFTTYEKDDLKVQLYCKRKADVDPKIVKFAFKLAEKNVGPQYKSCCLGWQPKIKQADLNKNWARYLVATKDKVPVAYSMFRFDLDYGCSVLYCYEMQVDESCQRKGLGGFMMTAIEKIAAQNKLQKIVLTVLSNNEDGLKFYRRLGYTTDENSPDASEKVGYEIMSKNLN